MRAKSAVGFDRGFTGYLADNETGLMYARARMYSPGLGRFVSRDYTSIERVSLRNDPSFNVETKVNLSEYLDGYDLYYPYFAPNDLDYTGHGNPGFFDYNTCKDQTWETTSAMFAFPMEFNDENIAKMKDVDGGAYLLAEVSTRKCEKLKCDDCKMPNCVDGGLVVKTEDLKIEKKKFGKWWGIQTSFKLSAIRICFCLGVDL